MISFLLKIWGLARPYRGRLLLGVLTGIIGGLLEPLVIATFTFVFQLIFSPGNASFVADDIKDLPAFTIRLRRQPDAVAGCLPAGTAERGLGAHAGQRRTRVCLGAGAAIRLGLVGQGPADVGR